MRYEKAYMKVIEFDWNDDVITASVPGLTDTITGDGSGEGEGGQGSDFFG